MNYFYHIERKKFYIVNVEDVMNRRSETLEFYEVNLSALKIKRVKKLYEEPIEIVSDMIDRVIRFPTLNEKAKLQLLFSGVDLDV